MTVALALLLLLLVLTASFAHYFNRKLFTKFKKLTELNELQPIKSDSYVSIVDISCTLTLISACALALLPAQAPFKRLMKA